MLSLLPPIEMPLRRLSIEVTYYEGYLEFPRASRVVTHLMDGTLLMGKMTSYVTVSIAGKLQSACTLDVSMFILTFDFWNSFRKDVKYKYNSDLEIPK